MADRKENLSKLRVVDLKARLASVGLTVSGVKHELIERLQHFYDQANAAAAAAAAAENASIAEHPTIDLEDQEARPEAVHPDVALSTLVEDNVTTREEPQVVSHQETETNQELLPPVQPESHGGYHHTADVSTPVVEMQFQAPMDQQMSIGSEDTGTEPTRSDEYETMEPALITEAFVEPLVSDVNMDVSSPPLAQETPKIAIVQQTIPVDAHDEGSHQAEQSYAVDQDAASSEPAEYELENQTTKTTHNSDATQDEDSSSRLIHSDASATSPAFPAEHAVAINDESEVHSAQSPEVDHSNIYGAPDFTHGADLLKDAAAPAAVPAAAPATDGGDSSDGVLPDDGNNDSAPRDTISQQGVAKKEKRKKKKKKRRQRLKPMQKHDAPTPDKSNVEIEYVPEKIDIPRWDPNFAEFTKIFDAFKLADAVAQKEAEAVKKEVAPVKVAEEKDPIMDEDDLEKVEETDGPKLSKKKLKMQSRLSVAELKQLVTRPDVVEMHDVNAKDPKFLVFLKAYRNTVPVPRHWCFKRKYLQGKRGFVKPPFELPEFIKNTGIMEMRAAMQEKEDAKNMKSKQRAKVRPKLGKIDIDYQKLHDAFFKYQTKPKLSIHGDLYYEGKEFETKLREKKPGDLSDGLRTALGMPVGQGKQMIPPPWLIAMQRYGPPPSYPNLKIPGLNAPIPDGASFGYHAGGWGKPPVDEMGKPLYGDVFGMQVSEVAAEIEDEEVDRTPWGELESEEESEESEEEEEEDVDRSGLITPGDAGLVTPSGLTSIPIGMETPDLIELRKRKEIEEAMDAGNETPALYAVVPEKRAAGVGAAMMASAHVYDIAGATHKKMTAEGIEVTLDPSELDLDTAAMSAKYEETIKERDAMHGKEDLSDMVAEHVAKKKRKKPTDSGKAAKKYKEFKF